jgi:acylphosphatase
MRTKALNVMLLIAREILCIGKVQGVFYRASTQSQAKALQLRGWVKNQPDGTVLIHAEGSSKAVDQLVTWCRRGPEAARVDQIEVKDVEAQGFDDFNITR